MADEDDFADEDYDYEFDDATSPSKPEQASTFDENADDQHTQKVNGQLEAVQAELNTVRMELDKEKEEHEHTKRKLEEKLVFRNDTSDTNDEELKEAKKRIHELEEELDRQRRKGNSQLMETFMDFGITHSLSNPAIDTSDMTEEICISMLKQVSRKLQDPVKPMTKKPSLTSSQMSDSNLQQRIHNLEEELRNALGAAEDIRALKAKAVALVERIRQEKEDKLRIESEQKQYIKKIEMLSDHVEKLMIHLKHEAAAKIKAVDQLRMSEKRNRSIQESFDLVSRKGAAKDRLIAELREGSKILEDQLRLMDEKYLELRTKLDYAREVAAKKVRTAQKTASDLRVKFALAGNQKLLDHMPLPDINTTGEFGPDAFSRSMPGGTMNSMSPSGMNTPVGNAVHTMGSSSAGGGRSKNGRGKKKSKSSKSIAQNPEQAHERVMEKLRRLRGGEAEWTVDKARKLVS